MGVPLASDLVRALDDLTRVLRPLAPAPCAWTRPGSWHITLKFLGDTPAERVADIESALAGVRFVPFVLRPGPALTFPPGKRPRVLTLALAQGGAECASLARSVDTALTGIGFSSETRPFTPHLTLARVKANRRDTERPAPGSARAGGWPPLLAKAGAQGLPAAVADRFVLWRSFLAGDPNIALCGLSGPEHLPLRVFAADTANESPPA
ncbi:hypothetical protein JCM15519_28410 [Fundidesulfovibrio butyratiphilus]